MNGVSIIPYITLCPLQKSGHNDTFEKGGTTKAIFYRLHCLIEPNVLKAKERKLERYQQLLKEDIKSSISKSHILCFEVGIRGYVTKENKREKKNRSRKSLFM